MAGLSHPFEYLLSVFHRSVIGFYVGKAISESKPNPSALVGRGDFLLRYQIELTSFVSVSPEFRV
ncbi:hypothetical protein SAMN06265347_107156 [Halobellus salinus]|nr:hypothetical protein SAMN06265347_107156 [Halobellus salinus]